MRLWHEALISQLPRPQILGQHRECCALRGNGWGRKHATVDYVFTHSPYRLYAYHDLIMEEMASRGYKVSPEWLDKNYRGKTCPPYQDLAEENLVTSQFDLSVFFKFRNDVVVVSVEPFFHRKGTNIPFFSLVTTSQSKVTFKIR